MYNLDFNPKKSYLFYKQMLLIFNHADICLIFLSSIDENILHSFLTDQKFIIKTVWNPHLASLDLSEADLWRKKGRKKGFSYLEVRGREFRKIPTCVQCAGLYLHKKS